MLFGSASATLIGLLFVAASVGFGVYRPEKRPALRTFLSPSVVHFTCVLAASLIAICPLRSWMLLGVLIGGDGVFGLVYAGLVWHRMVRHGLSALVDLEDRIWYAALPAVAYAIMSAAAAMLVAQREAGCAVLAMAMGLLMLVAIRNVWDITVWTVAQHPE